jgi:hypothetical protein
MSASSATAAAARATAVILRRGAGAEAGDGVPGSALDRLARSMAACSGVTTPRSSIRRMRSLGSTAHLPDQARRFLGARLPPFDPVQHPVRFGLVLLAQALQTFDQRVEPLAQGRITGAERDRQLLQIPAGEEELFGKLLLSRVQPRQARQPEFSFEADPARGAEEPLNPDEMIAD